MYSRELDGQIITLAASGWTYNATFVLYDHETESMWYHLEGEDSLTCISGTFARKKLAELPATLTRWNQWYQSNRDTGFLAGED